MVCFFPHSSVHPINGILRWYHDTKQQINCHILKCSKHFVNFHAKLEKETSDPIGQLWNNTWAIWRHVLRVPTPCCLCLCLSGMFFGTGRGDKKTLFSQNSIRNWIAKHHQKGSVNLVVQIQFWVNYPFKAERNEDDESSLCDMQCSFKKTKYRLFEDPTMMRFFLTVVQNKRDSGVSFPKIESGYVPEHPAQNDENKTLKQPLRLLLSACKTRGWVTLKTFWCPFLKRRVVSAAARLLIRLPLAPGQKCCCNYDHCHGRHKCHNPGD